MREALYKHIQETTEDITGKMLDVGCGIKPYQKLFNKVEEYVGMEFNSDELREKSKADFFYDGKSFPFQDNSFDSIICTEVLEHIFNPDEFLSEINRVLKPNGKILLTTPFVWYEHSEPYDYGRYSSFGLSSILNKHKFQILKQEKLVGEVRAIAQLISGYIYHKISIIKNYKIKVVLNILLISPVTICGIILSSILPKSNKLYLDNFVIAKKDA